MKNIKWWQWALIAFVGFSVLTNIIAPRSEQEKAEPASSDANAKFIALSDDRIFAMTVNPKVDPDLLPEIAREHCGSRGYCNVMGWIDPEFTAKGFPMTPREVKEVKFQYLVNRVSGLEQSMWDCRMWKQDDEALCLPID